MVILLSDCTMCVVEQLGSVVVDEVKSVLGVEEEVDRIKSTLSSILAVLRDAEKQQSTSESVKNWLQNLQDVVYDIDDLLDEFATEAAIHSKNKGHMRKQVRKFFSRSNFVVLRRQWVSQIEDVRNKLDRVAEERKDFVFFSEPSVDSLESSSRETHSKVNESEILGREQDTESIIDLILSCKDCQTISVLPIVGMGWIGKTTVAKLIYNDNRVDDSFDEKLWVYVSEQFNINKILRQIISMVTGESYVQLTMEQLPLEQLRIKVSEALKDKKYFLLLDDVWNEDSNKWRQLKDVLDVGAKGSMVVVTTRHLKVASMVKKSVEEYELSQLSDETCLRIFTQLAFEDGEETEPTLMSLANEIVPKSRGIPFLVTTLGNLLRGRTDEREWHLVIKKLEEGHEDIMNILQLSYDRLPSYLKRCFRFCCIFGKGTNIDAMDALYLWMALGFLPFDNRGEGLESLEFVGWKCIDELASKSLFQTIKNEHFSMDEFSQLRMHDFVYDLAKSMAGDEVAVIDCTTKEVSKNARYIRLDEDYFSGNQSPQMLLDDSTTEEVSKNTRYIRLDEDYLSGNEYPQSLLNKAKNARLLMLKTSENPLSKSFLQDMVSNLKCLRVLDLDNSQFEELPRTIGYLKHLRGLSLGNNLRIKVLPNSICNLLNLQYFNLGGCINLMELPTDIERLENLRFLSVTTKQKVLPQGIGSISTLRYLWLQDCSRLAFLPLSTMHMENLQMLLIWDCKEFNLEYKSWSLEGMNSLRILLLKGLPKLQMLPLGEKGLPFTSLHRLIIMDCEGLTAVAEWIQYLTSLRTLVIGGCPNLVILPQTFSMLKNLVRLRIQGYPDLDI